MTKSNSNRFILKRESKYDRWAWLTPFGIDFCAGFGKARLDSRGVELTGRDCVQLEHVMLASPQLSLV